MPALCRWYRPREAAIRAHPANGAKRERVSPLDDQNTLRAHAQRQRALNRESRAWSAEFAGHRSHVTELLGAASGDQQLCVLGAGNCNDIDLSRLAEQYRGICLADIDAESLNA